MTSFEPGYTGGGYQSHAPSVGDLLRRAALDGLNDAVQRAHAAGDVLLRDALCRRWNVAIKAGTFRGLASLSHTA